MGRLRRAVVGPARRILERTAALVRTEAPRNLYWSVFYTPNFGDWVGPYLYVKLTGHEPSFRVPDSLSRETVYVTAGSVLELVRENCIVWGSGIKAASVTFPKPWRIHAVRGPHSRQRVLELGYECPEVFGDPAILLPRVYRPRGNVPPATVGIIPHFRDYDDVVSWYAADPDVRVIDVRHSLERVVDEIAACSVTVSSSLHGIIVSHAYGVPCVWTRLSDRLSGDGIKFRDYFASAGIANQSAIDLRGRTDPGRLRELASASVPPDLGPLAERLLAACPFPLATDGAR
jgi:pyruvyltransferase